MATFPTISYVFSLKMTVFLSHQVAELLSFSCRDSALYSFLHSMNSQGLTYTWSSTRPIALYLNGQYIVRVDLQR